MAAGNGNVPEGFIRPLIDHEVLIKRHRRHMYGVSFLMCHLYAGISSDLSKGRPTRKAGLAVCRVTTD